MHKAFQIAASGGGTVLVRQASPPPSELFSHERKD